MHWAWKTKNGETWHYPSVSYDDSAPKHTFAFPCVAYCSNKIRRPHLTCLRCGIRRTNGQTKPRRVHMHIDYIPLDLPRWKQLLIRYLHSIAEVLQEP